MWIGDRREIGGQEISERGIENVGEQAWDRKCWGETLGSRGWKLEIIKLGIGR